MSLRTSALGLIEILYPAAMLCSAADIVSSV